MFIIPARLASTRFKHKILADINGKPMFVQTALGAAKVGQVAVACDEPSVLEVAKSHGLQAVLTSRDHESGTDRICEAAEKLGLADDEIIINIQADEPFFEQENLRLFADFAARSLKQGAFMASCYKQTSHEEALNPNLVKVVLASNSNLTNLADGEAVQEALYFSRSLIPYPRSECETYFAHIGIYAYSVANLREFCALQTRFLENTEKLEQLRALAAGKKIAMMRLETQSIGIDTLEDLKTAQIKFGFSSNLL